MERMGSSEQLYKYNGKEFIETHGLDTLRLSCRGYYPAISRFMSVDPLAEKYYSISPYAYCGNNPVKYVDPMGKWIESAWDVFSFSLGVKSFVNNIREGKVGAAIADGIEIVIDAVAVVLPAVPGGARSCNK